VGGCKPAAMFRVLRLGVLELQMHEPSGQLDQAFEKSVVRRGLTILQPKMLQHIMGLVVALRIEAFEIAEVAGVMLAGIGNAQRSHEFLDALGFFQVF